MHLVERGTTPPWLDSMRDTEEVSQSPLRNGSPSSPVANRIMKLSNCTNYSALNMYSVLYMYKTMYTTQYYTCTESCTIVGRQQELFPVTLSQLQSSRLCTILYLIIGCNQTKYSIVLQRNKNFMI